jgi:plasmid stabilization system protein ParE
LNYRLTSAAEEEFAHASLYLLKASPQAALSFVDDVTETIEEIAKDPKRNPIFEANIRVKRTQVHPYSIFYRIRTDHVEILSISHDARREGHWKDRT